MWLLHYYLKKHEENLLRWSRRLSPFEASKRKRRLNPIQRRVLSLLERNPKKSARIVGRLVISKRIVERRRKRRVLQILGPLKIMMEMPFEQFRQVRHLLMSSLIFMKKMFIMMPCKIWYHVWQ